MRSLTVKCRENARSAAFASAAVLCGTLAIAPAAAQQSVPAPPPSITIEGAASATLAPDTAILSLGVVTTRPKATDAVAENGKALGDAIAAIKAEGVAPEAITTTALDLSPVTDQPKTGAPKVVGYQAKNQIEVRIRTSTDVGKLAALLIDKGINSVDGITFASSEEQATRDRLRGEAAKTARHEAEIYTSALGLKLGRVLGIRLESDAGSPLPMRAAIAAAPRPASEPVPIEPGQLRLTETVSVTFELVQ